MLEYFLDTDINNAINGRITSVIIIVLDRYYIVYTHTHTLALQLGQATVRLGSNCILA